MAMKPEAKMTHYRNLHSSSSDSKSILTLHKLDDNRRSTCSSESSAESTGSSAVDTSSMITISSWHTNRISKVDPVCTNACSCVIY